MPTPEQFAESERINAEVHARRKREAEEAAAAAAAEAAAAIAAVPPRNQIGQTTTQGFDESRSEKLEKERVAAEAALAIAAANATTKPAGSLGYSMPNDPTAVPPRNQIGQTTTQGFDESRSEKLE